MFEEISRVLASKTAGKEVKIGGWAFRTRSSSSTVFAVLRDQSGIIFS